ncbi:uncharacterized protein LOC110053990 [Orbicella faveolata]|uniref:uncharacterized protein LOC110053990 n=1 Tax=Orbicella faveolata TaxID=48498 RepID=UPI0009E3E561|nr:uncharacterized protein LOC110053990 [Orbicella faveolata]
MNHKDVDPAHLTASNLLPPIINTSGADTQDPTFPAIYSPTGIIHPVNRQSSANQQPEANIADLHQTTASGNQSILDLGTGHQANLYPEINNPVNPHDHENYPSTSQPPAAFDNVGTPSTCHASTQNITSQTITSTSLAGTSTPLQTYPFRNVNTSVTYQHPAYTISSLKPAYPRTYQLSRDATIFTPNSSPATHYREITPSPCTRNLNPVHSSTDNATQIAEALAKVTRLQRPPQAKPDIFTGDETDTRFFIWETAFDALIDSAPISSQQKLYLLYQHLGGKAKKVVEQLQYMVAASPEVAYNEARKKLKSRFGRPAIIAADFENKQANWPKIAINDAQALREYSDFLQQVEIAKTHLHSLKIFEFPSKLQTLVEKLPNWFSTKWSTKVQTLQQEKGSDAFPTFVEFVAEVAFHAERMNTAQINQNSTKVPPQTTRSKLPPPKPPLGKKTPFSTTMASKTHGESEPSHSELTKPEFSDQKLKRPSLPTSNKLCLFHGTKTHNLNECNKFRELTFAERKDFFKKNKLCFKCMSANKHSAENCNQAPPVCNTCHKRHSTALHVEQTPKTSANQASQTISTSTACTQVCGEKETGRSCARIVLVNASHRSNPAKKITTYAVLDDQSTDVFISDALLNNLERSTYRSTRSLDQTPYEQEK